MATLGLPLGFKRLNSFPIDSTAIFENFSDLSGYAADINGVSYIGQICSVTGSDTAYIIKSDRTLQEIGVGGVGNFYPLDSNPSGYATTDQLSNYYLNSNISGFITGIDNLVYTTGDQNISGVKNFYSIPTVSGVPLALSGQNSSAGAGELFTGDITEQINAPYDGIVKYITAIPGTLIRTPQGIIAFLTKTEGTLIVKESSDVSRTNILAQRTNIKKDISDKKQTQNEKKASENIPK
jgi:hypothetical protein